MSLFGWLKRKKTSTPKKATKNNQSAEVTIPAFAKARKKIWAEYKNLR
jgi:hypothetical protein